MQFVSQKQFWSRLAVGAEGYGPRFDEFHTRRLPGVILNKGIDRLFLVRLPPAGNARTQRDEYDFRLGQFRVDRRDKLREVRKNLFRRFSGPEIIASGPQENHARMIREDDAVGEMRRVHDFRATKTTVDNLMLGEILCQRFPQSDR